MCGIAGLVAPNLDPDRLRAMTDRIAHRGPDDSGVEMIDGVGLGHRRLSIIDLSPAGRQPMANEDGSVRITYNGELFGFGPLRDRLEAKGHRFRSRSDTEVLIHLYEEEGPGLFEHVNGQYAFAIHDRKRKRLLLGRDRLGIKPLFYAFTPGGGLVLGSELKAILSGLGRRPRLRSDALAQYLLQGYVSAPDTIYEGIFALPPGHYLDVDLTRPDTRPEPVEYWDPPFTGDDDRPVEAVAAELEELLADAVRIQMVADVPLGAFLSGGIDSSTVVAFMASAGLGAPRTFTVDVPGTERSEKDKARAVAVHCGTTHQVTEATAAGIEEYWRRLEHFDAPFNCPSLLNTYLVSAAARRHVTVALSGDGGDEMFGGYTRYLRAAARPARPSPAPAWRTAAAVWPVDWRGRARVDEWARDDCLAALTARHPIPIRQAEALAGASLTDWVGRMRATYERHRADPLTRFMYLDLKTYLHDQVLAKVDNASMAVALEVRVPLLDHRVVELAGRVPAAWKVRDGSGKALLKRVAGPRLPRAILDQAKTGFDAPLSAWVFDQDQASVLDALAGSSSLVRRVLDRRRIDRAAATLRGGRPWRVPQRSLVWSLYQLERWLRTAGDG